MSDPAATGRAEFVWGRGGVAGAAPTQQAAEDSTADGPVVKLVADTPAALASALRQAASVWSVRGDTATINLRPGQLDALRRTPGLRVADVPIPDLALLVAEQEAERRNKSRWTLAASQAVRGARRDPFFDTYREYEVIHLYMEALALECGPQPHPSPVPPPRLANSVLGTRGTRWATTGAPR